MNYEKKDIELRSDEYQEIVEQPPRWIIRSGVSLILGFLLLLLVGSYFFRYPDVINSPIVVLSENPPAYLAARTAARIDSLMTADQQMVAENQVIAILESTASFDDVIKLREFLRQLDPFVLTFDSLVAVTPDIGLQLGDIQSDYSSFVRLYNDYFSFLRLKLHQRKIKSLKQQVSMNRIYYDRLWLQKQNLEADLRIAATQFNRDSLLLAKGVLSDFDLEKSKTILLQKKFETNGIRTKLAEIQSAIIKLEQDAVDVEMDFTDQKKKAQNSLIEAINVLKSRLAYWEQLYIIKSPISGRVSFTSIYNINQQVKKDEVVFNVISEKQSQIIGRISLPLKGAGKVAIGQKVNIRFDNFPYMEFGFLQGTVRSISLMPNNENYVVEVELPQDMKTNYGIQLKFSQEMKGTAEIITEDLRLIERFFNPFKSVIKHRVSTSGH